MSACLRVCTRESECVSLYWIAVKVEERGCSSLLCVCVVSKRSGHNKRGWWCWFCWLNCDISILGKNKDCSIHISSVCAAAHFHTACFCWMFNVVVTEREDWLQATDTMSFQAEWEERKTKEKKIYPLPQLREWKWGPAAGQNACDLFSLTPIKSPRCAQVWGTRSRQLLVCLQVVNVFFKKINFSTALPYDHSLWWRPLKDGKSQ